MTGCGNGTRQPDAPTLTCLTCSERNSPERGRATQRGIQRPCPRTASTAGDVEKGDHAGKIGITGADPGKGILQRRMADDGGRQAGLAGHRAASRTSATIWPRLTADGKQIAWSQMLQVGDCPPAGSWTMKKPARSNGPATPDLADRHEFRRTGGQVLRDVRLLVGTTGASQQTWTGPGSLSLPGFQQPELHDRTI